MANATKSATSYLAWEDTDNLCPVCKGSVFEPAIMGRRGYDPVQTYYDARICTECGAVSVVLPAHEQWGGINDK